MTRDSLIESVSGIRGPYGPNGVDEALCRLYGKVYGGRLRHQYGEAPLVAVGMDPAPLGPSLADAFVAGIEAAGCEASRLGIVTTPMVDFAIREGLADAGAMVTASHCDEDHNGLKLFNPRVLGDPVGGGVLSELAGESIIGTVQRLEGRAPGGSVEPTLERRYIDYVLSFRWFGTALDGDLEVETIRRFVRSSGLALVLDPNGGSACGVSERLAAELGFEKGQNLFVKAGQPGQFDRLIEPTEEALQETVAWALERVGDRPWFGLGSDCDADRGVVFTKDFVLSGHQTLALAVDDVLSACRAVGRLPPVVVNEAVSNLVADVAAGHGCEVIEVPVGEAHTVTAIEQNHAAIGGESSGVVFGESRTRDGTLLGMAFILRALAMRRNPDLQSIVETGYPKYYTPAIKLQARPERMTAICRAWREHMSGLPSVQGIRRAGGSNSGIKAMASNGAWLLLRPSRTEVGTCRLCADSTDPQLASELLQQGCEVFEQVKARTP